MIMEGISPNLLEQLIFKRKVVRTHHLSMRVEKHEGYKA